MHHSILPLYRTTAALREAEPALARARLVAPAQCRYADRLCKLAPTDAYRGAGRPEAAYFVERAMDMLARELEMDPADLRRKNFIQPDQFPYTTQMGAVYDSGDYEKALEVKAKMAKFAAALLEAHESDLVFENGAIAVKGTPASARPFAEVAAYAYRPIRLPEGLTPGLSDEAFFEPTNNTYPFGCHFAMLEVDRETGEPRLLKMVAVDDAGHLINPLIVEGQIHGGLAQGIAGADRGGRRPPRLRCRASSR